MHPLKVYNSVVLVYSQGCVTITLSQIPRFHHHEKEPRAHERALPTRPSPEPLTTANLFFCLYAVAHFEHSFSYERNHTLCGLCVWLFSLSLMFSSSTL